MFQVVFLIIHPKVHDVSQYWLSFFLIRKAFLSSWFLSLFFTSEVPIFAPNFELWRPWKGNLGIIFFKSSRLCNFNSEMTILPFFFSSKLWSTSCLLNWFFSQVVLWISCTAEAQGINLLLRSRPHEIVMAEIFCFNLKQKMFFSYLQQFFFFFTRLFITSGLRR